MNSLQLTQQVATRSPRETPSPRRALPRRVTRSSTCCVNCSEFIEVLFATARIGALLVPLNWRLAAPELDYQLADAGARVLFTAPEQRDLVAGLTTEIPADRRVGFGVQYEALLAESSAVPIPETE